MEYLFLGKTGPFDVDLVDLPLLETFRGEYEKRHAPPLRSAADIAGINGVTH